MDGYYITDDTGYRMPDDKGETLTCDSIEGAERWIAFFLDMYRNVRWFWIRTDDGRAVCQYKRDFLDS